MAIKYYYIDDDPLSTITETAKGLSVESEKLTIIPYQHKKWDEEIDFLIENQNKFDGLLLDWNLTGKNDLGVKANFNIEALAQQIRRLVIEKTKLKKDFPIVLCSANYRFKDVFSKELTSHDLFDKIFEKDDFDKNQSEIIRKLEDLAQGYIKIGNAKNIDEILKTVFGNIEIKEIDYRVLSSMRSLIKGGKPSHEISRFMLSKVINKNGVLIDKYLLAARLGVDILTEGGLDEWNLLLEKLKETKFNGVFSNGWERWWMNKLNIWWESKFDCLLGSLNGPKRVKLLNEKFKLNLKCANLAPKSKSEYFWTVCKESHCPIAYEDGIILASSIDKLSWEDDECLSIEIAIQKGANEVHPFEKDRLKKLKTLYTKIRNK
jgi:hypothetical protein